MSELERLASNGDRIKIGLALGSGAFRGMAHIGAIEVLEQEKIPIDFIAGSSIGAMIGGAYAAGRTVEEMRISATTTDEKSILDVGIPRRGFLRGKRAQEYIRWLTYDLNIEEMHIPFAVVACDLDNGERVVFTDGPAHEAIRGSISVPGVFEPHEYRELRLVDGGVVDRVPADIVRAMGADVVIAVDVGYRGGPEHPDSLFEVIMRVIEIGEWNLMSHIISTADVQIIPDVSHIHAVSLRQAEECIALGREAALAALPDIRACMARTVD